MEREAKEFARGLLVRVGLGVQEARKKRGTQVLEVR